MRRSDIRVGTSGWYYDHWKERFYPPDLSKNDWFPFYARQFDTVEINNTYYKLPARQAVQRWHDMAPKGFLYTAKANRFITHVIKLRDAAHSLQNFLDAIEPLGEKLGPILYQLPPSLRKDLPLLRDFIDILPPKRIGVFEFRNNTWFTDDVFDALNGAGLGFCIHDLGDVDVPRVITGDVIYLRFHGPGGEYNYNYPEHILRDYADWVLANLRRVSRLFAYFNNDYDAWAVENARQLRDILLRK